MPHAHLNSSYTPMASTRPRKDDAGADASSSGGAPSAPSGSRTNDAPSNAKTSAIDTPKKSQKEMTKAERREMQERQRAAKKEQAGNVPGKAKGGDAASAKGKVKGGIDGGASSSKAAAAAGSPSATSKLAHRASEASKGVHVPPKDAASVASHDVGSSFETRGLRIFSHFGLPKPPSTVKGSANVIHPAIVRLGLQFSRFKIVGGNARCIATLTAFKTVRLRIACALLVLVLKSSNLQVIQDYSTPPNTTLSRHLTTHLNPLINHIVNARPMAVTMGNAIRQLKLEIAGSDIDMPEQDVSLRCTVLFFLHLRSP